MSKMRENEYFPETVPPPGEELQEILQERGVSQRDLAARIGRSEKHVSQIINGHAPITAQTALQLERALGVSAEFWNNYEQLYRDSLARQQERQRLEKVTGLLERWPIKEIAGLGWIRKCEDRVDQLRELLNFFGQTSPAGLEKSRELGVASYRKSDKYEVDEYALAAWLQRGKLRGQEMSCDEYDQDTFRSALRQLRAATREPPEVFQPKIIDLCAAGGVAVAFVPALPKIRASGAARWLTPRKALIQVNLRYKADDHFWFTLFHEAGHVLLDSKKELFVDGKDILRQEQEKQVNRFAADFLVPQRELRKFADRHPLTRKGRNYRRLSKEAIKDFARQEGVAPGIVVGQLQHLGYLPYNYCNGLKRKLDWAHK